MQDVKVHDARGTAFDMIERQSFEAAAREAQRPTMVPDGELREIKRLDQAGRVSYDSMANLLFGWILFLRVQEGDWWASEQKLKEVTDALM